MKTVAEIPHSRIWGESEKYRKEVRSNRLYIIGLNFWQQIVTKSYCFEFGQLPIEDNIKKMFTLNRCWLKDLLNNSNYFFIFMHL